MGRKKGIRLYKAVFFAFTILSLVIVCRKASNCRVSNQFCNDRHTKRCSVLITNCFFTPEIHVSRFQISLLGFCLMTGGAFKFNHDAFLIQHYNHPESYRY